MNELAVACGEERVLLEPGEVAYLGRSADNAVVVNDPRVSRQHLRLTWGAQGWLMENMGRGGTYLFGQQADRFIVERTVELRLAAIDGPAVVLEPEGRSLLPSLDETIIPTVSPGSPDGTPPRLRTRERRQRQPALESGSLSEGLNILVPISSWLKDQSWRRGLRLLVIPYGLLPLVFIQLFQNSSNLTTPGWAYSLYVSILWLVAFWFLIRPGQIHSLEVQIGVVVIALVLVGVRYATIPIERHIVGTTFIDWLGVGVAEEITKALPVVVLALLLLHFRSMKFDVRMWMFMGTVAGLAFGVYEASGYTSQSLYQVNQHPGEVIAGIFAFSERVFVDGFQHAIWAGISGFFIGMAVNYRRRRAEMLILGLAIAALLHGLYDWSTGLVTNSLWPQIAVAGASLFLFLGYTLSAASIEREVRRTPMFRGESILLDTSRSQAGSPPVE